MVDRILPTLGSSGTYTLLPPFHALVGANERYTCQSTRTLSECLANNETPKDDIYIKAGLSEEQYLRDVTANEIIVGLQSDVGHWLYIPAKYIGSYPVANGIPYRSMAIGISLPAIEATRDYSFLVADLRNLISDRLGVDCTIRFTETSRVSLVPAEVHAVKKMERAIITDGKITDRSQFTKLAIENERLREIIAALEDHIVAHAP